MAWLVRLLQAHNQGGTGLLGLSTGGSTAAKAHRSWDLGKGANGGAHLAGLGEMCSVRRRFGAGGS